MNKEYLGKVDYADPLFEILFSEICPDIKEPLFHVNMMSSRRVYKYTEEKTRIAIIGGQSDIFLKVIQTISMTIKRHLKKLHRGIHFIWQ